MLAELNAMAESVRYRPADLIIEDKYSTGMDFLLRQVTPGFDETIQSNFALLQMIGNETKQISPESCISTTIDDDKSLFGKSI